MAGELRVGLVGCGRIAERGYLPAIRRARGVRIAALADPEVSRCAELAPAVPRHASAGELLAAGGVDALILATPAAAHLADATLAAAAAVPTLVEKPPAVDAAQAAELAALEPAPWIGFNRRFEPGLGRLRSKVPAEGSVDLSIELHYPGGSWGSYVVTDDVLASSGSHLIDLARWLTGSEIEGVRSSEVEAERARVELGLGRGSASISCRADAPHRDRVEIRQAGRPAARYAGDGTLRRLSSRLARPTLSSLVALLVRELEEFAQASRGGSAPNLATAADGLAVMAAIDAVRAAGSASRAPS